MDFLEFNITEHDIADFMMVYDKTGFVYAMKKYKS